MQLENYTSNKLKISVEHFKIYAEYLALIVVLKGRIESKLDLSLDIHAGVAVELVIHVVCVVGFGGGAW